MNYYSHSATGVTAYWLVGYALAFGSETNRFVGGSFFWALYGLPDNKFAHFVFQYVFASAVPLIPSGAIAERIDFVGFSVFSAVVVGVIYSIITHWTWAKGGWLFDGLNLFGLTTPYQVTFKSHLEKINLARVTNQTWFISEKFECYFIILV